MLDRPCDQRLAAEITDIFAWNPLGTAPGQNYRNVARHLGANIGRQPKFFTYGAFSFGNFLFAAAKDDRNGLDRLDKILQGMSFNGCRLIGTVHRAIKRDMAFDRCRAQCGCRDADFN